MKWLPIKNPTGIDQYAIRSDCNRYTIARVYSSGQCWYQAWRGKDFMGMSEDIGQAKRYAELDLNPERHENGDGV